MAQSSDRGPKLGAHQFYTLTTVRLLFKVQRSQCLTDVHIARVLLPQWTLDGASKDPSYSISSLSCLVSLQNQIFLVVPCLLPPLPCLLKVVCVGVGG